MKWCHAEPNGPAKNFSRRPYHLADLVAELGRYSPALLRVDPSIADLRVTGSFPLKDTRLALQALEPSLPVRSVRHNAWWFEVVPR